MGKSIVNMHKWSIGLLGCEYNLCGIADNHPKLGTNVYICYTSTLENAFIEDDVLIYETKNTEYHCPLKYVNLKKFENTNFSKEYLEEMLFVADKEDTDINKILKFFVELGLGLAYSDFTNHIILLATKGSLELIEKERLEEQRLLNIVKEYDNSIYIEMSNIGSGEPLAYNIDKRQCIIKPNLHIGLIQDSILYVDNVIDFRYFPNGQTMNTYAWSDNIEQVIIKNMKEYAICFNNITIQPHELKIIKNEN